MSPAVLPPAADACDFLVLINDDRQYSLWPASRPVPEGWRATGFHGSEAACITFVDSVWADMRPHSSHADS